MKEMIVKAYDESEFVAQISVTSTGLEVEVYPPCGGKPTTIEVEGEFDPDGVKFYQAYYLPEDFNPESEDDREMLESYREDGFLSAIDISCGEGGVVIFARGGSFYED